MDIGELTEEEIEEILAAEDEAVPGTRFLIS
jgi:hypothetical protein